MSGDVITYLEENDYNATYIDENDPAMLYLLLIMPDDHHLMIKSLCDENGKIISGYGFAFLVIDMGESIGYYKFIVPYEYWAKINCNKACPTTSDDIIPYEEMSLPLSRVKEVG